MECGNKIIDETADLGDNNNNSSIGKSSYTPEQESAVNRILGLGKDYYKILDVPKEASAEDLKKAYRKIALQIHPDKNNAPGSGEAFKKVGTAMEVLSKPEKRRQFDAHESDDEYEDVYDDDDDDDDFRQHIFEHIFGSFFSFGNSGFFRSGGFDGCTCGECYGSGSGNSRHNTQYKSQSNYSARYQQQSSNSDFLTKEKMERERNVKSTFTTKGSRDDDYDIDMVLKSLGETKVNGAKKKSKK